MAVRGFRKFASLSEILTKRAETGAIALGIRLPDSGSSARVLNFVAMNHAVNDGSIFSAQTIGGAVFGLVSGYLSTEFGLPIAFIVAGLLMLLGSGWAFTWLNHTSI